MGGPTAGLPLTLADVAGDRPAGVPTLADDTRLATLGYGALAGGCLVILIPAVLVGLALLLNSQGVNANGLMSAGIAAIPALFLAWLVVFVWYRLSFYRRAVTVTGAPPAQSVPRVVEAADGVIEGTPEIVLFMRTRSTAGRHGNCRVEFYAGGIQVKNPRHPESHWQFSYANLVHAESIQLVSVGGRMTTSQNFVRLIAARPRMAFLFGNSWYMNRGVPVLVRKLREHGVETFDETFEV